MRLLKLEMKNFGPYKGKVELDLKAKSDKNLLVIWGTNGSGKTHILKAIKWCLYGCDPSLRRQMQYGSERDAWEVIYGTYMEDQPPPEPYMYVHLWLEVDSDDPKKPQQYLVKRSVSPRTQTPMNATQIKCDFEVIIDGRPNDSPREAIEALLPLAASQFFMFHGEEIREMSQRHMEQTRKAIELILEAETFRQGKEDLRVVAHEIDIDLDDERRKSGGVDDLLDLKRRLQEKIQSLETECAICKNEIAEKKKQLDSVQMDLAKNEDSRILKSKLDELSQRLQYIKEERKKILARRGDLINDLPSKLILPELIRVLEGKEARHKKREEQRKEISELDGRLQLTKDVLTLERCVCGRPITGVERERIKKECQGIEETISKLQAGLEEEDPTYYEIRETVSTIKSSKMDFEQFKKDLNENALRHDEIEGNIKNLEKKLSESKIEEIRNLVEQRDRLLTEIGKAEQRHENFTIDLETQRKRLEEILKILERKERHDSVKESLDRQYDLVTRCISAFESVLTRLSDVRRRAIGSNATEIFRKLTNKPEEYDRIEVDDQFNVSVIDKRNNVVHRETLSTGEREVVALSFILGLMRASEKVAPLVLDTFFVHLDESHYGNIVKTLPSFADQIILILTDLEYQNLKERATSSFFKHVAQTWRTMRNQAEFRSTIVPEKEGRD
jgi:DNA sulfur modification protein DndD